MLTSTDRLLQVLNSLLLARVAVALLVVEPTKLLENLGVVGVTLQHASIGTLSRFELDKEVSMARRSTRLISGTYILLLLVDVADLEPDVLLGEGARGVINNILEALWKEK